MLELSVGRAKIDVGLYMGMRPCMFIGASTIACVVYSCPFRNSHAYDALGMLEAPTLSQVT